jgi:hypothetical protein
MRAMIEREVGEGDNNDEIIDSEIENPNPNM